MERNMHLIYIGRLKGVQSYLIFSFELNWIAQTNQLSFFQMSLFSLSYGIFDG